MNKIELLSPAGSMEKLKTVLRYGADAVYMGGKAFSLRAQAQNFQEDQFQNAIDFAHALGKKVYVTVNIIARNKDIEELPSFLEHLEKVGVDAIIVSDVVHSANS